MRPPPGWTLSAVALAFACGSCGGSSGGGGGASDYPFSFSVSTPSFGRLTYTCSPDSSGVTTLDGFLANCDDDENVNGSTEQVTEAVVQLAGYHGSDTYAFQGSSDITASFVQFTLENEDFRSAPASPGIPGTSCSVVVTGPATLSKGDAVTGTFHCDDIQGVAVTSDAGFPMTSVTSADGQFAGTVLF